MFFFYVFLKCFSFYIVSIFSFGIESRYSALVSLSVKKFWEIFFAPDLKDLSCIVGIATCLWTATWRNICFRDFINLRMSTLNLRTMITLIMYLLVQIEMCLHVLFWVFLCLSHDSDLILFSLLCWLWDLAWCESLLLREWKIWKISLMLEEIKNFI